jgi:hypothetical protein
VKIDMPVLVEFREQGDVYAPVFMPAEAPPSGATDESQ